MGIRQVVVEIMEKIDFLVEGIRTMAGIHIVGIEPMTVTLQTFTTEWDESPF